MKQYHDAIRHVLDHGIKVQNRTGVPTLSVFGYQTRFNLQDGFPAVTSKKLAWKAVVGELLWFLEGSIDERRLAELTYGKKREELIGKTTIWTANADAQGVQLGYENTDLVKDLGPVYGSQWRNFRGHDQITSLFFDMCNNSDSRRMILSAWNPPEIIQMALPPCHVLSQYRVIDNKLSCLLYQRSCDTGLGMPFNIASYALLTHILAKICELEVGDLVYSLGDMHIYENHIDALEEQLTREPHELPTLNIECDNLIGKVLGGKFDITDASKFTLNGYRCHDAISMKMAV